MTSEKAPPKYADWHRIGLQLLLAGERPTAQGLIDGRGGGSMTTATAALNEFYADYLPSVLSAATLGAPAEIKDLVGDIWTRLAGHARAAAVKEFDQERGQLQDQARRLEAALADAGAAHQAQSQELEAALANAAREEARAIGAEGQLAEQQRIVADLNRALSQLQRDVDRQAGELAQARAAAAERKTELAALREEHRTTLVGIRGQYKDELTRLKGAHAAALKALSDQAAAAVNEHERAVQAQEAAHLAQRTEHVAVLSAAAEREASLRTKLEETASTLVATQAQLAHATQAVVDVKAERDRLGSMVDTLQQSVQALSSPSRSKTSKRKKDQSGKLGGNNG